MKNLVSSLSRREFLITAMGAGGAMLLGPAGFTAVADEIDPRLVKVMSGIIGVDMHNHVYPAGTEPHPQHGPQEGPPPRQEEHPQTPDLSMSEEIKRSGLTAVCASFVLDFAQNDKPGNARDNYLSWLTAIDRQLEKEHILRALNLKDLQTAHDRGQPTIDSPSKGHSS
jgi:membrane dipeptidase